MAEQELIERLTILEKSDQDKALKLAQLQSENEAIKRALKQLPESIQSSVAADVKEAENKMTRFLGDRVEAVAKKADTNLNEITGLKIAIWGDKDRVVGLFNEQLELERKIDPLLKMKDQWDGNGTEGNPGIPAEVSRLSLKERDRDSKAKQVTTFLSLGGLTLFGIVVSIGWTLIQRGLDASASRAQTIENRLGSLTEFDRTISVIGAKTEKDIEWIKKSLK
jgi:hypothetical protein